MKTGTKSLLFGVHQFLWHPITVYRAWVHLYGTRPDFWETVAILVHDWGYWGCEHMDDARGERHPIVGANIIARLYLSTHRFGAVSTIRSWDLYGLVRYHSRHLAANDGHTPSKLCWADKASMSFDPPWFYILRARLSGEISEYRVQAREVVSLVWPDECWFRWCSEKCYDDARLRRSTKPRTHHPE